MARSGNSIRSGHQTLDVTGPLKRPTSSPHPLGVASATHLHVTPIAQGAMGLSEHTATLPPDDPCPRERRTLIGAENGDRRRVAARGRRHGPAASMRPTVVLAAGATDAADA